MADQPQRVRVEEIDIRSMLPFVRLFDAFWMAIWPPNKLMLALLMVILLFVGGKLFSVVGGPQVLPNEITTYARNSAANFEEKMAAEAGREEIKLQSFVLELDEPPEGGWAETLESPDRYRQLASAVEAKFKKRRQELERVREIASGEMKELYGERLALVDDEEREMLEKLDGCRVKRQGVFEAALQFKLDAMGRLVRASITGDFGFDGLAPQSNIRRDTVLGALDDVTVELPSWLMQRHPVFFGFWCIYALVIWSCLGGAISRLAALHAGRGEPGSAGEAIKFVRRRWRSFFSAPLIPIGFTLGCGVLIALFGLAFNWPMTNILGGLLFGILIFFGFLAAMSQLLLATGSGLFYPAICVEGTDAMQAVSNAGSYVANRFWRWLFYTLVSLVYGAIVYLIFGLVIFLSLKVTRYFAGTLVYADTGAGNNLFDVMFPDPKLGVLDDQVDIQQLGPTDNAAAFLINLWVKICIGLLGAFAISFYFCAHTWIYLLLRQVEDGAGFDEVYEEPAPPAPHPGGAPDKVEPAPASPDVAVATDQTPPADTGPPDKTET